MRVLIVDDSKATRRLLGGALSELGVMELLEAESAEKALEVLRSSKRVDLILTDWHMPGVSGLDLLKRLRATEQHKTTPIVLVTSETAGENVVAAIQAGATNYIIKPFNKTQIEEKLGHVIKAVLAEEARGGGHDSSKAIALSGTIQGNELGEVLQFFIQTRRTGTFVLDCSNCQAEIYFREGRVVGAKYQMQKGEEAFHTCMTVAASRYSFRAEEPIFSLEAAIHKPTTGLLLDALAQSDHHRVARPLS